VFVYHASAGHVRSTPLRVLLALAVPLLPIALLQIANSGVNTPWYLLVALFWALLWRPPSRAGMAVAALIGFAAATSNVVAAVFVVLVIARVVALPRLKEHAVTAGWLAGCLVQLPYLIASQGSGSPLRGSRLATPGETLGFYGHQVLTPAFGWHMSWLLRDWAGPDGSVLVAGAVLAVAVGVALVTGSRRVRAFVLVALAFGFVFVCFDATITWWVTVNKLKPYAEPGSRYTALPILLIQAAAIVAIDGRLREAAGARARIITTAAVLSLAAVLCIGWIPDFRYLGPRTAAPAWAPILSTWERTCQQHNDVRFWDNYNGIGGTAVIPCARIRGQ
jgi:hypothetical protein